VNVEHPFLLEWRIVPNVAIRFAIEEEVADVFAWLCSLGNLLDIDLSEALIRKYPDVCYRCQKAPCQCKESEWVVGWNLILIERISRDFNALFACTLRYLQ